MNTHTYIYIYMYYRAISLSIPLPIKLVADTDEPSRLAGGGLYKIFFHLFLCVQE